MAAESNEAERLEAERKKAEKAARRKGKGAAALDAAGNPKEGKGPSNEEAGGARAGRDGDGCACGDGACTWSGRGWACACPPAPVPPAPAPSAGRVGPDFFFCCSRGVNGVGASGFLRDSGAGAAGYMLAVTHILRCRRRGEGRGRWGP